RTLRRGIDPGHGPPRLALDLALGELPAGPADDCVSPVRDAHRREPYRLGRGGRAGHRECAWAAPSSAAQAGGKSRPGAAPKRAPGGDEGTSSLTEMPGLRETCGA